MKDNRKDQEIGINLCEIHFVGELRTFSYSQFSSE